MADVTPADTPLLERDAEVARLHDLVASACREEGRAAAVTGPAGIGKSALLGSVRRLGEEAAMTVLWASGSELEQPFPFGVVRQLLDHAVRRLPAAERDRLLAGAARPAAAVLDLDDGPDEPVDSPFAGVHGLYWLCAGLAERRPLLLLVDDVHWADEASLRFLHYLARRADGLAVLVVVAARPPAGADHADLVEAVTGDPAVVRLAPSPLSEAAVGRLLARRYGEPAAGRLARAVHRASGGNPFLCETVVDALAAQGAPWLAAAAAADADAVDEAAGGSAAGAVVRRIGRLPPPSAALARAVAVLGRDVELRQAAAVAGLPLDVAAAAADDLAARGLVRSAGTVGFVHPIVRTAVRDATPPAVRTSLHATAARSLAADGAPAEVVASHLLAAVPAGDASVVATLRTAARAAVRRGAPDAAVTFLRRAGREPPGAGDRPAVLHELAVAEFGAGRVDDALATFGSVETADLPPAERVRVARDLGLALFQAGRFGSAVEALGAALATAREVGAGDLALHLAAERHQCALMDPAVYRAVADGLDPVADVPATTAGGRAMLAALATEAVLRTSPMATVAALAGRAFAGGLLDDAGPAASGIWVNAAVPLVLADAADADAVTAAALEAAGRRGSPIGAVRANTVRALFHLCAGDAGGAEGHASAACEIGADAGFPPAVLAIGLLVQALVAAGDLDGAERRLRDTGRDGDVPRSFPDCWVLHARARLRLAQDRVDDAVADLDELGRRAEHGWRPWNPVLFAYRSDLAMALLRRGDGERARAVAEEELALARRWGAPRVVAVATRAVGLATPGADRVRLLDESVRLLAGSGARLERAVSLLELGAAVRRDGRRAEAREPLREALDLATACGAGAVAARAREELLAAGGRPRRTALTGVAALTSTERRVARMAAGGSSNKDIARSLFVTVRTVEVHLTHAYQKLGISSRSELPAGL